MAWLPKNSRRSAALKLVLCLKAPLVVQVPMIVVDGAVAGQQRAPPVVARGTTSSAWVRLPRLSTVVGEVAQRLAARFVAQQAQASARIIAVAAVQPVGAPDEQEPPDIVVGETWWPGCPSRSGATSSPLAL